MPTNKAIKPAILILFSCHTMAMTYGQKTNWQNLDLKHDSVFGISTERAYKELLAHKRSKTVIVALIDDGVDTSHEDLKGILWTNRGEKPANGKDDDHNGYIDDIHGWNFLGSAKGNVKFDNIELVRLIRRDRQKYGSLTALTVPDSNRPEFKAYQAMLSEYNEIVREVKGDMEGPDHELRVLDSIAKKIGKDTPTLADFEQYRPTGASEEEIRTDVINELHNHGFARIRARLKDQVGYDSAVLGYALNFDYDPRSLVGDDYNNDHERFYGNNDVCGPDPYHGTHCAGIIAAVRDNGIGIQGIADNVRIMVIRACPDGDERDKDIANAIRYAVDNGARVINMSFGKKYSWDKKIVDEAVKYAMQKDVLLVCAAGNDGNDIDKAENSQVPSKYYADGSGEADAWITVGASQWLDDSTLVAPYSNYGKRNVDVFAPGKIYSCLPGSKYGYLTGTSMAAPVVTGLAALIREYYPRLTAVQIKDIIVRSVTRPMQTLTIEQGQEKVKLSDICTSGGIVNAYNALKLASTYPTHKGR